MRRFLRRMTGGSGAEAPAMGYARWGRGVLVACSLMAAIALGTSLAGDAAGQAGRATPAAAAEDPGAGAQALFDALLKRTASYRDFRARFSETPFSRATGEGATERGVVSFKRPGRWRWEYLAPEKKLVIIRDGTAVVIVADDPEVSRYELGGAGGESGVGALLEGGERLSERFLARTLSSRTRGESALRLDPTRLSDEYEYIVVRFGTKDLVIREVMVEDPGGNRLLFRFEGFTPALGLENTLFELPSSSSGREP